MALLSSSRLLLSRLATSIESSSNPIVARRFLNLHEFQSKALLDKFGVRTQPWALATTPEEAEKAAHDLRAKHGTEEFVIKSQIHAGGRGVGRFSNGFKGGVHLARDAKVVRDLAQNMLGHRLITKQTSSEGVPVTKLMIAHALDFNLEYYLSVVNDRNFPSGPVIVFCPDGGVDIESVAEHSPELIQKIPIDINKGLSLEEAQRLAYGFGFHDFIEAGQQLKNIYELFVKSDCTQLEINPWVQTKDQYVYAIDAKLNFDESAQFRQKDIFDQRDPTEEDPREVAASKVGLNYIGLDGTIGCMVNGAGLAMATMDEIKLCGGSPANFLDVGGGATEEQVANAFRIITSDPNVQAILINIFGGIMRCDVIARGIVEAAKKVDLKVPMVVRLAGTNYEEGAKILNSSGLKIITGDNLNDAAKKAVASLKK